MPHRSFALLSIFVFVASFALSAQSSAPTMKNFRETDFGMTFIYPASFIPADPRSTALDTYALPASATRTLNPPCVRAPLSLGSLTIPGKPAFVLSIIDDACPGVLKDAQQLGPFTRTQILRQLKRYGTPAITREPRNYTVDGRPSTIVLAAATADTTQGAQSSSNPVITYAAKVCMFGEVPVYTGGHILLRETPPPTRVICFDFTTRQPESFNDLLSLPIQFGDYAPRALVPASILR